ncbi:MICOS complex subunit MIC25 [Ooceraea biroi]|uniref:Coiled-coil-helix-coiled-coil-helix domain-containing protein 3, mitochondrial n=1 Tax=Ooceraea biroi TaxID=2015173 RepID=A0A026W0D7_OOCBI|nr:MICOS complex subunit MIC25 [Ooceraea biroi]EZA49507.1 hypothetical protein X777_12245 [Ooceraea biroi]
MGSGQSARKLTISNEEDLGVIKVSNAIVQRLAQGEAMIDKSSSAKYDTAIQHSAVSSTPIIPPQADAAAVHPMHYYPELTMSALQIQQRKEEELKQQEQYWQRRLQNLKEGYQRIERTLEEEYKKAVNETSVAQVGHEIAAQDTAQPCLQNSNKILQCFQDHPKETLRCSNLVEEFSNCVWNMHYTHVIKARA